MRLTSLPIVSAILLAASGAFAQPAPTTAPAMPEPTLISLHYKDAGLNEVLADLSKQAGITVVSPNNSGGMPGRPIRRDVSLAVQVPAAPATISIDLDNQPFAVALREVCIKSGLQPQADAAQRVTLFPLPPDSIGYSSNYPGGLPTMCGPVMVVLAGIQRNSSAQLLGSAPISRNVSLRFVIISDPKVRMIYQPTVAKLTEATDAQGRSLLNPDYGNGYYQSYDQPTAIPLLSNANASLVNIQPDSQRIASLKGLLRLVVQTQSDRAEVGDILSAAKVEKTVGGIRLSIDSVTPAQNGRAPMYQVDVSIFRDGMPQQTWDQAIRLMAAGGRLRMLDSTGKALPANYTNETGRQADTAKMRFTFMGASTTGPDGDFDELVPAKLVIEVPTQAKEMMMPFEFSNVPLTFNPPATQPTTRP